MTATFAAALPASAASAAGEATQVVTYHGYQLTVPASWPVYDLATDPAQCVLFSTHAVYLGTPGANQNCPAREYGRTEAILIQPSAASSAAAAASADATGHTIQVSEPGPGVAVTATYGTDPSAIRSILATGTATASTATTATTAPVSTAAPATGSAVTSSAVTGSAASGPAADTAAATAAARAGNGTREVTGSSASGLGFDACTAPSEATMRAWLASPYRVVGTYLGGVNWACDYGNFSAQWVRDVAAMGWKFIPIWVGEQASCSGIGQVIDNSDAAAEGAAEAADAVTAAQSFGYAAGSTLYYDMEGYDTSAAGCSQGVLTFLSAWTQALHAAGYQSGVYSSAGSGMTDLASQYGAATYNGAPYESPDAVWIGDWDGNPALLGDPYVPDTDWPAGQRMRQFAGSRNETWGGATLNIDPDIIGGPVSALRGAKVDAGPALVSGADAVTVAPGRSATLQLSVRSGGAAEHWQVSAPAGLTISPGRGTVPAGRGRPGTIRLTVRASAAAAAGRYDVPVTFSSAGTADGETFELVSVTPAGTALATGSPIVLYAADATSMAAAKAIARADALPATDVTGTFTDAWTDLTGGQDLVIAVGDAAVNGLFYNPCNWNSPSGSPESSPFYWLGTPFQSSPGADIYEPADGTTDANSALLAAQLVHFALAGTLPDYNRPITQMPRPTQSCLGSDDVPVS